MATRFRERTTGEEYAAYRYEYSKSLVLGTPDTDPSEPEFSSATTGTVRTNICYESMEDIVTPRFHRLKSNGTIVNSPMSKHKVVQVDPLITFSAQWTLQSYDSQDGWYARQHFRRVGTVPISFCTYDHLEWPDVDPLLASKALTKAYSNIGSDKMLFLASMAEANEAVVGLGYILRKVYKIFKALRRADLRRLRKEISPSELREIYLNARYNLRPLMYDAKALSSIASESMKKARRQTFRATMTDTAEDVVDIADTTIGISYFSGTVSRTVYKTVTARAGVLTEADQETLSNKLGLSMIGETAWDLVPFSFILDWFVNAGDTLSSWLPKSGYQDLASWTTVTTTTVQTLTVSGGEWSLPDSSTKRYVNTSLSMSAPTQTRVTVNVVRTPDPGRATLPVLDVNLDPLKLLDLAAILSGVKKLRDVRKFSL